jgi:uncharacterized Zn finger protein
VAVRRAQALKKIAALQKKGQKIQPVKIQGRTIAQTFWGRAWCDHLEKFSDYANRLPRGRTYVRNGSVCHLEITEGSVKAMVSGSELYHVQVTIGKLPKPKWNAVKDRCAGQIGSLLELLGGKLSENVMGVVTDRDQGLFPSPKEISLKCSCPDWAVMCKHVAAVLYGVAARLDEQPELLFLLRGVNHEELIHTEADVLATTADGKKTDRRRIAEDDLAEVFGIEMSQPEASVAEKPLHDEKKVSPSTKARVADTAPVAPNVKPVTGQAVAKLRAKFNMSQSQFARLLGVSAPTVGKWEKTEETFHLKTRTLETWNAVATLTKRKAWQRLEKSG